MSALIPFAGRAPYVGRWAAYAAAHLARQAVLGAGRGLNRRAARVVAGRNMPNPYRAGSASARRARFMHAKRAIAKKMIFSRKHVGESNQTYTSKASDTTNDLNEAARSTRTLYAYSLTNLTKGTNENQRLRSMVNCRGFKICHEMRTSNNASAPLYANCAVIAPKHTEQARDLIPLTEFFRANFTERSRDFNNSLTGLEFHCTPINTDEWVVLRHKRYILNPQSNSVYRSEHGSTYKTINWWIPMKRQLRYNSTGNGLDNLPTDGQVFFVFWFAAFGSASGATPAQLASTTTKCIMYYREPKH